MNSQPSTVPHFTTTRNPPTTTTTNPPWKHAKPFEPCVYTIKSRRCQHVLFHSQLPHDQPASSMVYVCCASTSLTGYQMHTYIHTHLAQYSQHSVHKLISEMRRGSHTHKTHRTFSINMTCKLQLNAAHSHVCTLTEPAFTTDDHCVVSNNTSILTFEYPQWSFSAFRNFKM